MSTTCSLASYPHSRIGAAARRSWLQESLPSLVSRLPAGAREASGLMWRVSSSQDIEVISDPQRVGYS